MKGVFAPLLLTLIVLNVRAGFAASAADLDYQVKATSEALTALQSVKSEKPDPNRENAIEKIRTEL